MDAKDSQRLLNSYYNQAHQEMRTNTFEMNGKIENLNKDIEDIKRNQMEIIYLKNTMI